MVDTARARRLAKRIVSIVATQIQHEVKDPRLDMVTITAATVTPDLREATVYYTVYGDDDVVSAAGAGLASATGVLRSAVGAQTGIKFTPTLEFRLDAVPANAHRIDELLAAARDADARVAQQAAGASYAGDADPYKAPRALDDESGDDPAPESGEEFAAAPALSDASNDDGPGRVDGSAGAVASQDVDSEAGRPGERVP
jgi:ribosome-binding factor A